ncbi:uncharacterized protein LOC107270600 isoform X1 [Cephus cinctus]|uniref:Uncharacterized protein LOC107270600 isoform X1 n=1 Tax=Cephus cinctus TaxID=211228 RepID=A0AAJ7C401_CEPCN|nr:uncharacterized protein LOC107270600 isoform X1 [Cephus cinctus]
MFNSSSDNVDNLVHRFVQNLGVKIEPVGCNKAERIKYIKYVDKARKMKRELLRISEKTHDMLTQGSLDFSDVHSIQSFMEKRTNLFDKFYMKSTPLLAPHLRNINKKITQSVTNVKSENERKLRRRESIKVPKCTNNKESTSRKCKTEIADSTRDRSSAFGKSFSCSALKKGDYSNRANSLKCQSEVKTISKTSKIPVIKSKGTYSSCDALPDKENKRIPDKDYVDQNTKSTNLWWIHKKKENIDSCNLKAGIVRYTQRQTELNRRYLELQIKDTDFINQHVRITLHIAIKKVDTRNFQMTDSRYHKVLMLCKEAILSLIEPSNKAFVVYEDNLPALIKNHLTRGYRYHFTTSSASEDYYSALLILSHWAEILVRHPNTTLMRTISYALGCSLQRILVLSCPEDTS